MSVILYSRSSYEALTANSDFQYHCRQHCLDPKEFASDLYRLNCNSFDHRYRDSDSANDDPHIDSDFERYLPSGRFTDLYRLLCRIDYQVCEYDRENEAMNQIYYRLRWILGDLARRAMNVVDELEQAKAVGK